MPAMCWEVVMRPSVLGLRSEAEPVPILARTVLLVVLLVLALAALGWSTGA